LRSFCSYTIRQLPNYKSPVVPSRNVAGYSLCRSSLSEGESRVKEILRLYGDEYVDLENMLVVIRNGGWFGRWIATVVSSAARSDHPTEKYPTPLQVMQMLTLDNGEFRDSLTAAKEFAEQCPDLLFPAPPAEPKAVSEPVATSTKPKPRSARKGRVTFGDRRPLSPARPLGYKGPPSRADDL
jgi:hypothetical protein